MEKYTFNSHLWHNPTHDILCGKIDNDSFLTYTLDINTRAESMEYYSGSNYVIGSALKAYSRQYKSVYEIPSKYMDLWIGCKARYNYLQAVIENYKECALWASDIDGLTIFDFTKEADIKLTQDVLKFIYANEADLITCGLTPEQIGHSLWLTQNHHGAGFFDHSMNEDTLQRLTLSAHALKECNLFVNDSSKIEVN